MTFLWHPQSATDISPAPSLGDRVSEHMREALLNATWKPGDLLLEAELAEQYGVSKTPVREALRLLSQEGWIDIAPRRGYLVRRLRLHDVREIFELRVMIEPALIARTARFATLRDISELRRRTEEPIDPLDGLDGQSPPGREFHLTCARLSRNDRAAATVTNLLNQVRRLHHLMADIDTHRPMSVIIDDHLAMVDALECRNPETAHRLMREHIRADGAKMLDQAKRNLTAGH
ncbi:GntR family transcriptional regulator [Streptomyces sp. NPDC093252]|uniref:GntR family transcriptional regulator n=1 Tax=Streptomyces sp. NPDC093252 TaxID=3154980 RepID=UPI003435EAAB